MAKTSSKKRSSSGKYDIVIKAKATTTKIIDITNETVRLESNDKGQVRKALFRNSLGYCGRYYVSGWD